MLDRVTCTNLVLFLFCRDNVRRQVPVHAPTFSTHLPHRGRLTPSPLRPLVFLPPPFPLNAPFFSRAVYHRALVQTPSASSMDGPELGQPLLSAWRGVIYRLRLCPGWSFLRGAAMTLVRLLACLDFIHKIPCHRLQSDLHSFQAPLTLSTFSTQAD